MTRAHRVAGLPLTLGLLTALGAGCGSSRASDYAWIGTEHPSGEPGTGALRIAWTKRLTPLPEGAFDEGAFQPTERAFPALDPARDRIYVGTSSGDFFAFDSGSRRVFRHDMPAAIEAAPAVSADGTSVFVADGDGTVFRLEARDGSALWSKPVGGPVRNAPILTEDAVYVVTVSDRVVALARQDGATLWEYEREQSEELGVEGRAGLTLDDGRILTGFADGAVVALDATDGRVIWERDTSLDLPAAQGGAPRFPDVDTTPWVVGDRVFVASISGGLYALARTNGSVEHRDAALTGILGITGAARWLALTSVDGGVSVLEVETLRPLWRRSIERGAPTPPVITDNGLVLYGETDGSMLARRLATGVEAARVDAGTGFTSPVAVAGELGAALSNGGGLYVFRLH